MSTMASQIASITIIYSTVYSRRRSKKTPKPRVTGLCVGNLPVTGACPAQRSSNAKIVSIWWRHHGIAALDDGDQITALHMSRDLSGHVQTYIFLGLFYHVTTKSRTKRDKEMRTQYILNEMLMSLPVVTLLWQGSRSRIYVLWWNPRLPVNSFTSYSNTEFWFFPCC